MKDSLKFKGSKLIVQEAADPSTILWENLRVSSFLSMPRIPPCLMLPSLVPKSGSISEKTCDLHCHFGPLGYLSLGQYHLTNNRPKVSPLLLVHSPGLLSHSSTSDRSATDHGGNELCPQGFSDLTTEEQQQMVDNDKSLLHCYCDQLTLEEQKDVSSLRQRREGVM
jgi:hypothetical protein